MARDLREFDLYTGFNIDWTEHSQGKFLTELVHPDDISDELARELHDVRSEALEGQDVLDADPADYPDVARAEDIVETVTQLNEPFLMVARALPNFTRLANPLPDVSSGIIGWGVTSLVPDIKRQQDFVVMDAIFTRPRDHESGEDLRAKGVGTAIILSLMKRDVDGAAARYSVRTVTKNQPVTAVMQQKLQKTGFEKPEAPEDSVVRMIGPSVNDMEEILSASARRIRVDAYVRRYGV